MKQARDTGQVNRSRRTIFLAVFLVLAIGIATAVIIYSKIRAPFRATVLEVNETSIEMKYFLKRLSLARTNSRAMLQTLANEQIVKQTAPQPPYDIRVSENDIDRALEEAARSQGVAEGEQDTWYREQLKQTGFSDAEYKDLVRRNLLTQRMTQYLAERIPTVAEQVHLYMISQSSIETAREVKRRLDEGEDFYTLAREQNLDEELKASGGDLGWYTRSGMVPNLARTAFDELDIGQPSEPLMLSEQMVAIVLVAERAAARQIDEKTLQNLKSRVLEEWLTGEMRHHRIRYHGLKNGFDAETETWVQWQLFKIKKRKE